LIYIEGEKEPMRGLMENTNFMAGYTWKKAIVLFLMFLMGKGGFPKTNIFDKLLIIYSLKKNYQLYRAFMHFALTDNFYPDPDKYAQPVREVWRIFPKSLWRERDIFCFFMEADFAYRYRLQDIISEFNKEAFKKNPLKEITRLMDLMVQREPEEPEAGMGMKRKWNGIKKLLPLAFWYLRIFHNKLYKELIKAGEEINLEEIKPTKEDLYWMNKQESYNFRGLSYEARKILI
jgi:hypothetical protein